MYHLHQIGEKESFGHQYHLAGHLLRASSPVCRNPAIVRLQIPFAFEPKDLCGYQLHRLEETQICSISDIRTAAFAVVKQSHTLRAVEGASFALTFPSPLNHKTRPAPLPPAHTDHGSIRSIQPPNSLHRGEILGAFPLCQNKSGICFDSSLRLWIIILVWLLTLST